jgi:hypothetical protein
VNAKKHVREMIKYELGIFSKNWNEKYLGMPEYIGRSKRKAFAYINDKVWKTIHG